MKGKVKVMKFDYEAYYEEMEEKEARKMAKAKMAKKKKVEANNSDSKEKYPRIDKGYKAERKFKKYNQKW